jgi:putative FmdB family regulatory protein
VPIYSYICNSCEHEFELRQGFDASPEHDCPLCNKKARRTFHPVGVIYKGTGFYTTDYRRPSSPASDDLPSATTSTSSKTGPDDQD